MVVSLSMSDPEKRAVTPKRASTLILVGQEGKEIQICLLRRSTKSSFMPGNYVFPGGTVGSEDWDPSFWGAHLDLAPGEILNRFCERLTEEEAIAHGVAAIRETFEEAGVFLCEGDIQNLDLVKAYHRLRLTKGLHKGWLKDWVGSGGGALSFSRLTPWAHWTSPEIMSQRFDTRFFLALMPLEQECIPDEIEITHGIWVTPEEGLFRNLRGDIPLSPPAVVTLHELLQYQDTAHLKKGIENFSWGGERMPRSTPCAEGPLLLLPWDPMYSGQVAVDSMKGMSGKILPLGEGFSRLWFNKGRWVPVGI
ncbi:MAG: hypothetical protein ABII26_05155 [Pseudomonadota bacterium]